MPWLRLGVSGTLCASLAHEIGRGVLVIAIEGIANLSSRQVAKCTRNAGDDVRLLVGVWLVCGCVVICG